MSSTSTQRTFFYSFFDVISQTIPSYNFEAIKINISGYEMFDKIAMRAGGRGTSLARDGATQRRDSWGTGDGLPHGYQVGQPGAYIRVAACVYRPIVRTLYIILYCVPCACAPASVSSRRRAAPSAPLASGFFASPLNVLPFNSRKCRLVFRLD